MNTHFEFAVIAVPGIAAVAALFLFGRRHIHRQLDELAEAAKAGAFSRPMRFRGVPALRSIPREENFSPISDSDPQAFATMQAG
jgi:hypothetical protein